MLGQTLAMLAQQTWDGMDLARYVLGFVPDERYFTDRNLIELTRRHRPRVFATRTGIDEHATGADFEWWIRDGDVVLGLLVQAKCLHFAGAGSYRDVDRPTNDGRAQPDRLIATARDRRMLPLYVLYNGGRPNFPASACGGRLPLPANGTTIAAAGHIAKLASVASHAELADVQPAAIPWQCVVDCPLARRHGDTLPAQMQQVLRGYDLIDPEGQSLTELLDLPPRVLAMFEVLGTLSEDAVDDAAAARRRLIGLATDGAAGRNVVLLDVTYRRE